MILEPIRVNQYGNHTPKRKIQFDVTYNNGEGLYVKGLYLTLTPIEMQDGGVYTYIHNGNITESGFCFCVKQLPVAMPRLQKQLHTFVEDFATDLRDLFNAGRYGDIVSFVRENF